MLPGVLSLGFLAGSLQRFVSQLGGADVLCPAGMVHRVTSLRLAGHTIFDVWPGAFCVCHVRPMIGRCPGNFCNDLSPRVLSIHRQIVVFSKQKMHVVCHELHCPQASCPWCGSMGPYSGVRVGEAKVPGPRASLPGQRDIRSFMGSSPVPLPPTPAHNVPKPECHLFRFGVANPTSILHKDSECAQIAADLLFLSETLAVQRTNIMTSSLRARGLSVIWGAPVQSHDSHQSEGSLRGYASGVAILSSGEIHRPVPHMPRHALDTTRLVEAMVRFGPIELRAISVYGYPRNRSGHQDMTQDLLKIALERVSSSAIAAILGGDLNMDVTSLPIWEHYRQLGYIEAFQLVKSRLGYDLPATCRGSTRFDTFLVPPLLQPSLCKAEVMQDEQFFDAHSPLVLTFSLPHHYPASLQWKLPKDWTAFSPDNALVEAAYMAASPALQVQVHACQSTNDVQQCFRNWASELESAVDLAIRTEHRHKPQQQPFACLARSAKGRCEPRTLQWRRVPQAARTARDGDYSPADEAVSVNTRMQVRQVRRLQTYLRGRLKYATSPSPQLRGQLQQEWAAIVRARGYGASFPQWILRTAHFHVFWQEEPPLDWLRDMHQFTQHMCDAAARQAAMHRRKLTDFRFQWDSKNQGLRRVFGSIKPDPRPPFTAFPVVEKRWVEISETVGANEAWCLVQQPQFLRHFVPCHTPFGSVQIVGDRVGLDERTEILVRTDCAQGLPATFHLEQPTLACAPEELHREF